MSRVLGINGIHSHGKRSTDLILAELPGQYEAIDIDFPMVGVFGARRRQTQDRLGLRLMQESEPGDHIIAHSFGCLIAYRAMQQGAMFGSVIFLSAAMHSDVTFPYHGMKKMLNIYNAADRALWMGRFLRWGDFGDLGSFGYTGPADVRVSQMNFFYDDGGCYNHHHYFIDDNPNEIANLAHRLIQEGKA